MREPSCCSVVVRNGAYGRAAVRLALDAGDLEAGLGVLQAGRQRGGAGRVEVQQRLPGAGLELADGREVTTLGDPGAVDAHQRRGEAGGVVGEPLLAVLGGAELGLEVPVAGRAELDPLPLPVDDQPGRDRLDPARRQLRHDLLPQHRGDLVAVEPVEDAPGLVGVDLAVVELGRVGDGAGDRLRGDLVEDHPAGGDLGLELLEQVPGDGLALAVLVCRQVELVGVLEQRLELGDLLLLVGRDDVEGLEVVVDVDAEAGPRLRAELLRDLGRLVRHVADVADARLDHVATAEVAGDGPGLGGGLDDHKPGAMTVRGGAVRRAAVLPAVPAVRGRRCLPCGLALCWHALSNLTSKAPWPVVPLWRGFRLARTRLPPQVPYAARPRNARPCRYPCNPVSPPDCSLAAFRPCTHNAEDAGSSPTRLALFHGVRTIRSNGRV